MFKLVLIFSSFFVPNILCNIVDYCAPRICPSPGTHTGCHNNGVRFWTYPVFMLHKISIQFQRFSSACPPDIKVERMSSMQKLQVLDLHNYYRMQVALGNVETFLMVCQNESSKASQSSILFLGRHRKFPNGFENDEIGKVSTSIIQNNSQSIFWKVWEEEQAVNSLLQLKTCLSHDSCHNTCENVFIQFLKMLTNPTNQQLSTPPQTVPSPLVKTSHSCSRLARPSLSNPPSILQLQIGLRSQKWRRWMWSTHFTTPTTSRSVTLLRWFTIRTPV